MAPLQHIFHSMPKTAGYSRQILMLTDGAVYNNSEIVNLIRENRNLARVFTFGIGDYVDQALIKVCSL